VRRRAALAARRPAPGRAPTGFSLANPKLHGERDHARQSLERQPANRPAPGTAVVTDKSLSGQETEEFFAGDGLGLALIRPARQDKKQPRPFPNWLRQRVEAVIWTLKNQLGLERHGGRIGAAGHVDRPRLAPWPAATIGLAQRDTVP
jgi:hypothetical protein